MYDREVKQDWWLYILCSHEVSPAFARTARALKFYTGISNDPRRRLAEHNGGYCKATRGRKWFPLIAIRCGPNLLAARLERWFKTGNTRHKRDNALLFSVANDRRYFNVRPFLQMFDEEWTTWQNDYIAKMSPYRRSGVAYYNHHTGDWQQQPLSEHSFAPLMQENLPR